MNSFLRLSSARVIAVLFVTALAAGSSSCTRVRDASFPEGAGDNLFDRQLFQTSSVSLRTDSAPKKALVHSRRLKAAEQVDALEVREVQGPESLRSMFKGLEISGRAESNYPVRFALDRQFLTAYRVVRSAEELNVQDLQLSIRLSDSEFWVPLFQYSVQSYGQVARSKNDLGEETSTLRLKPTEWKDATHVRLSTLPEDRLAVVPASPESLERIFVRSKIDGSILGREELSAELQIRVEKGEQFEMVVDGGDLLLLELVSLDDASITASQRELIAAQDRGAPASGEISRCGKTFEAKLLVSVSNCVKVAKYRVPVTHVEARRKKLDTEGTLSAEVEFRPVAKLDGSRLMQIARDPLVIEVGATSLDPRRSLQVSALKNQEFLFRRTMEDSPNSFDYTFAGSSGPLEIVRILFEKEQVRIVRADALIRTGGNNRVDLADLMSLPVQYVREVATDAQGNRLARPRVIPSDHTHPDAVAYVSWERNSVPPVSSPLDYYQLGQCFVGPTDVTVSEVDHRLSDAAGVLNFSLNMTYANNPGTDCAGVFSAGYFDQVQASFTFKERISLRKYSPALVKDDEKPLLELPYDAQKKLGFGIFTYKKNSPNRYGNLGADGTEMPLPALFDLRNGKGIRYILAGLPEEGGLRDAVVRATREVVSDWNAAFRKAFRGTALERDADVIELLIEGEKGTPASALGDLDANHIYYISKRTSSGVIGLGGSHSNPRSGKVESASVYIYGGNILSSVESLRKMDNARHEYLKQVSSPLLKVEAEQQRTSSNASSSSSSGGSQGTGAPQGKVGAALRHAATGRLGISSAEKMEALSKLPRKPSELAFYEAMQESVRAGRLGDAKFNEKVLAKKLLQTLEGRISSSQMSQLRAEARRAESVAGLLERMEQANLCVHQVAEVGMNQIPEGRDSKSDLDLVIGVYKPTLAHELGHNLGLRHNFVGSFDKANWKFSDSESTHRDYSSVMDYLASDHETYDGLGPYDVAAIRAAYAGKLEAQDGSLLDLSEAKSLLKLSSWHQLARHQAQALPIRHYQFCSDEEAGVTPVCNRFDRGTSPSEIVQAHIDDYRSLYALTNFAGDRLRFSQFQTGGYVGRLFSKFVAIRQFLEETLYQAVTGAEGEVINDYAKAAIKGMQFFHSVIRTPDAPAAASESERVMEVALTDGRTIRIERRWLKDIGFEEGSDRLRIRGIEFDKVVALMMLTDRQLGFPRYEAASIRLSFPEFERMVFTDAKTPLELPTVALLRDVMLNQIVPSGLVLNEKGKVVGELPLEDGKFKSDTTEMIRFYGILGSIVSQDVDGLEAKDNGSRLFRVMSGFAASSKAQSVVRPGTSRDDEDQLKYWAPSEALVSQSLMTQLVTLEQVLAQAKSIRAEFKQVLADSDKLEAAQSSGKSQEETRELQAAAEKSIKTLDLRLGSVNEAAGSRSAAEFLAIHQKIQGIAKALEQASGKLGQREFSLIVDLRRTQMASLLRANPALAVALQAEAGEEGVSPFLKMLFGGVSLESEQGIVFGNVETLNRLMLTLHPELRRN